MIRWYIKAKILDGITLNNYPVFKVQNLICTDLDAPKDHIEVNSTGASFLMKYVRDSKLAPYVTGVETIEKFIPDDVYTMWNGIENPDEILENIKKNQARKKMSEAFGQNNNVLVFSLFKYINLMSKFGEYGIFINDRNREEQYIEIINKECPELLDYLQDYLDLREEIEASLKAYEVFENIVKDFKAEF